MSRASAAGALAAWKRGTLGFTPFEDVAKRHRVAQAFNARDAVLPLGARGAANQINGSRLCHEALPLESLECSFAQPECAGRQQRHPDHVAKDRAVPVPAYPRARCIFRDKNLLEAAGRIAGERLCTGAKTADELGPVLCPGEAPAIEIVAP